MSVTREDATAQANLALALWAHRAEMPLPLVETLMRIYSLMRGMVDDMVEATFPGEPSVEEP